MRRVLALGSNYEPVGTISWKKAVNLIFSDKAMTLAEYDEEIHSPSYSMKVPSVVVYKANKWKIVNSVRFSRKNVWVRDEGKCQYCLKDVRLDNFTIDHINPKSHGGKTTWDNVVTCCYSCNQKKGEKTLKEVGFKLAKQVKKPSKLPFFTELNSFYNFDSQIHPTWKYWLGKQHTLITLLDTETTGLDPKEHEVIDFGALCLEEKGDGTYEIIKKIKFKIKPKHIEKAQPAALKVNGYEEKKWIKAKLFEEHASTIKEIIESSKMLLGQNLIFDIRFLISEFKRCNMEPPKFPEYIDTKEMASVLVKEGKIKRSSMDYLCEHFNVTVQGRAHTALVDCERTFLVWQKLLKFTDSKTFTYTDPYEGFADNKK